MRVGPGEQLGAPLGCEHDAGRELVRGRHEDRLGARRGECLDDDAALVDRHRDQLEPLRGELAAPAGVARVLDGDAPDAAGEQCAREQGQTLGEAAETITMRSGSATAPRTRPRYSASAVRSSMAPRGSP